MEKESKIASEAAASTSTYAIFCVISWFALNMVRMHLAAATQ